MLCGRQIRTAIYGVSLRLGKGRGRSVPLTSLSRIPFFALIALFCKSLFALPFTWEGEPSIWFMRSGVPLGVARSKSVCVLLSSTRGAPDIAEDLAVEGYDHGWMRASSSVGV